MYRILSLVILFSLAACNSELPESQRELNSRILGRGSHHRKAANPETANPANPTQPASQNLDITNLTFPLQVVKKEGKINMSIYTQENNTKVRVETPSNDQVLNILAGFDGQVSLKKPRQITLTTGYWELVFDLEEEVSLTTEPNASVTRGEILASTTGPITFSLKKNGKLTRFCLNIINQSEGLVNVHIVNDEGQCEAQPPTEKS